MAKKTRASKDARGSGRGDVPTVSMKLGMTLNMGDFNSLVIAANLSNIDASSEEATRKEAEQAAKSALVLYEIVDEMSGDILNEALGEAGTGKIQTAFLTAIAETIEENKKKGLYKKS